MIVLLGAKSKSRPSNLEIPVPTPSIDNTIDQELDKLSSNSETTNNCTSGDHIKADFCDQEYDCLKEHFCSELPR